MENHIKIPFKVSARTARLIGRENIATSKGAIIELVKNGYDADSKLCIVYFDNLYSTIHNEVDRAHLDYLIRVGISSELINNIYIETEEKGTYILKENIPEDIYSNFRKIISDYPFMHLLYSQLLVCQRVCLQNTVCLICK